MEVCMDKYISLLKTWNGEFEDLSFILYDMLKEENESNRIQYFQLICENIGDIDSDESRKIKTYFEEGEIEKLKKLYGKYIDETINSVRKKVTYEKLGVSDFYYLLWKMVFENSILVSEKEKAFGLLWILADNGIPYYELAEPLTMDNDEYKKIVEANRKSLDRIIYILSVPFDQKTEVTSLILKEIENKDYKVQTVLLSQAFDIHSKKEIRNLKKFLDVVKEEEVK